MSQTVLIFFCEIDKTLTNSRKKTIENKANQAGVQKTLNLDNSVIRMNTYIYIYRNLYVYLIILSSIFNIHIMRL